MLAGSAGTASINAQNDYSNNTDLNYASSVFDLKEAVWRGNQGWSRDVQLTTNGTIMWWLYPGWSGPASISSIPGSGDLQAQVNYRVGDVLVQGFWRGNQGWTRDVPIVRDVVQWGSAPPFAGPINIGGLPGSGDMQAHGDYAAGSTIIQAIWRSNQGFARNVPIVNGVAQWGQASAWNWNNPISINTLPGSGDMQAQDNFAIYNVYYQTIWRGGQQYRRTVPIVNNVVEFGQASTWTNGTADENLQGSGSVQAQGNYVIDWRSDINPDFRRGEIRIRESNFGPTGWHGAANMYFVSQSGATTGCYDAPSDCTARSVDSGYVRINTHYASRPSNEYLVRHELGHVFGLAHQLCSEANSVMYVPSCGGLPTVLQQDEKDWIDANY